MAVIGLPFEVSANWIQRLHVPGHRFHYRTSIWGWKGEKTSPSDKEKTVCPPATGFVA